MSKDDHWVDESYRKNNLFAQRVGDVRSQGTQHRLPAMQPSSPPQNPQNMTATQLRLAALPPEYQAAQQRAAQQISQRQYSPDQFTNSQAYSQPEYQQVSAPPDYYAQPHPSMQMSQPQYSHPSQQSSASQYVHPAYSNQQPQYSEPAYSQQQSQQVSQPNYSGYQYAQPPTPPAIRELTEEEIDERAIYDSQTRAFNLRHTIRMLKNELTRAHYFKRTVATLVVSIDSYEKIVMEHGENAAEKAIDAVARSLITFCRPVDMVGRYTEGRFIVVCPEMTEEEAAALAEKVRKVCDAIVIAHQWQNFKLSASVGVACSSPQVADVESLIALADLGADMVSEQGGNGVFVAPADGLG